MLRAIAVTASTIVGLTGVVTYAPAASQLGVAATSGSGWANSESVSAVPAPTLPGATATSAPPASGYPLTVTGSPVSTQFGDIQIAIKVSETHEILDIVAVASPDGDRTSAAISARAIPALEQEALTAQSADVSTVSGASYTSEAFAESLQSAISKAQRS
ncbi:MAG: FMN-binding protein [Actinomycetes bacterium]